MPRTYKPTGTRRMYPPELLKQAVASVNEGKSIRATAEEFKIEKMFLCRHITKLREELNEAECITKKKVGGQLALSEENEVMIAHHLKTMAKWGFALGKSEVLDVIEEYVQQNELITRFKNNRPGNDWFVGFCKRQKLSLKKLEALEKTRRIATSDPFIIYHFYNLLEKEVCKLELLGRPENIFNLDETSFSADPSRVKRLSGIGQKAHRIAEASSRENTTVMACVSASGRVLPPMIVFKSSKLWSTWRGEEDLPGTMYACSENGWMTTDIFQAFFTKFCEQVIERPLLLILDGHITHLDISTVNIARRENVSILKLPAHTTDVLQPLDVSCFKSLKYTWDLELVKWYRENQRKMTKSEFVSVLCRVWNVGLKPDNVIAGFTSTGIYPINRDKYPVDRFDPEKYQRYKDEPALQEEDVDQDHVSPEPQPSVSSSSVLENNNSRPGPSTVSPVQSLSFEKLLLQKIKRTETEKKTRKRLDPKGCVITSEEWTIETERKKEKLATSRKRDLGGEKKIGEKRQKQDVKDRPTAQKGNMQVDLEKNETSDDSEDNASNLNDLVNSNSSDDIDLCEPEADDFIQLQNPESLNKGDFAVASFKGGKRGATMYRYVVLIQEVLEEDEFEVMGLKSDSDKQTFKKVENDISVVKKKDIVGKLPVPNIVGVGDRFKYYFDKIVDVFEVA